MRTRTFHALAVSWLAACAAPGPDAISAAAVTVNTDAIAWAGAGTVDANATGYLYAPTVMFDETEGLYKLWGCGGVAGDYIIYKQATTLAGLAASAWGYALTPLHNGAFDDTHTCDPSVIRVGGAYYLYYGGLNEQQPASAMTTRLGVARSTDGGRTFQRLNGGNPIITLAPGSFVPGAYGVGQPAVAQAADGWFYMVYTHIADPAAGQLRVIRSQDPAFLTYQAVRTLTPMAYSVDLAFNPSRNQLVLVAQTADVGHGARVRLIHYDARASANFAEVGDTVLDADPGFRFGEGVGILTNSTRQVSRLFQNGTHVETFVGATYGHRDGLPDWITGPVRYAQYTEGAHGVIDNFAVNGWDVGVYNPFGTDGNFYVYRGDSSGVFADQTAWHWGAFPAGKVFTGDFDGDGRWDVGLYNPLDGDGNFFIQYGDGAGGFGRQTAWHWGVFPSAQVFTGDFNGDGKWDVGLFNPLGDGRLFFQHGNGAGGFAEQRVMWWVQSGQVLTGRFRR